MPHCNVSFGVIVFNLLETDYTAPRDNATRWRPKRVHYYVFPSLGTFPIHDERTCATTAVLWRFYTEPIQFLTS